MDWRARSMRRPAVNEPGQAHELTFSCFRGYAFLQADRTCQWLANAIDAARRELEFAVWAYVFMPEHVHVLILPRRPVYDVPVILQEIKEPVGRKAVKYLRSHAPEWLARITVERGERVERRFWQAGGGYDRNVWEPATLLAMIEYIHNNPVRRGLVTRAEDWKWSSAGWRESKNSLRPDPVDFGGLCVFHGGRG
jgi:REP-associated tyrosine transposase